LFRETFGTAPEPLVTATLATRRLPAKQLEAIVPAVFVEQGVAIVSDSLGFLGREFLLWLWHETESGRGTIRIEDAKGGLVGIGVAFDEMRGLGGARESGRILVRGDAPTRAPEAGSALLSGRMPLKARLVLSLGEKSFDVTLTAETFDLESVKVTAE